MNRVALLLGSNMGDRLRLLQQATGLIRSRIGSVVAASSVHETEPWGEFQVESGEWKVESGESGVENFLNQALLVETPLPAREVLREALRIEQSLGRSRGEAASQEPSSSSSTSPSSSSGRVYSSRPIDIDIIFFNHDVIDEPGLEVPHPRMHLRRFVLEPLAEIMPGYRHPRLNLSVQQLLSEL